MKQRKDKATVTNIEYISRRRAIVEVRWYDNEEKEWIRLKGVLTEEEK